MMEWAVIIVVVILAAAYLTRSRGFAPPKTLPSNAKIHAAYAAAPSLFVNGAEAALFHALHRALPAGYYVQTKVRLEDIFGVSASVKDARERYGLRGRVKSRHVDFLIIDDQGKPRAAIELDGAAYHGAEAKNADALKNGIFKASGIPLHRIKPGQNFARAASDISEGL